MPENQKVWVCMSCGRAYFSANRDYAECVHDGHAMYVGFVWPAKETAGDR